MSRVVNYSKNYEQILQDKDARSKIFKVLELIRVKYQDVPMICKYRKYEYQFFRNDALDEEIVWLIYNFD